MELDEKFIKYAARAIGWLGFYSNDLPYAHDLLLRQAMLIDVLHKAYKRGMTAAQIGQTLAKQLAAQTQKGAE